MNITMSEMKNTLQGFNGRVNNAEKRLVTLKIYQQKLFKRKCRRTEKKCRTVEQSQMTKYANCGVLKGRGSRNKL